MFHLPRVGRTSAGQCVRIGVGLGAALLSGLAIGAESGTDDGLSEIVVTAERRPTRLQDTPISITALTEISLQERGVGDLRQLDQFVPNLQLNPGRPDGGGSNAQATIRGIGQQDYLFPNEPGVGTYLDGVYIARTAGGLQSLVDIEQIEVLRGPQGTLFGRNTIGGAINIVTSAPTENATGHFSATIGRYNRAELKGTLSGPLVADKLFGKFSFGEIRADGYGEQILTGHHLGNENRQVARFALRYLATGSLELTLAGDYTHQRQSGQVGTLLAVVPSTTGLIQGLFNPIVAPAIDPRLGLPAGTVFDGRFVTGDPFRNYGTRPSIDDYDTGGVSLTAEWRLSDSLKLNSISAVRGFSTHTLRDSDNSPYDIATPEDRQSGSQLSEELHLQGSAFEHHMTYLLGTYVFSERAKDAIRVLLADGTYEVTGVPALDINEDPTLHLHTENYAAFGQATYSILPDLDLTLGLRENFEHKKFTRYAVHPDTGEVFVPLQNLYVSNSSFTPKAGLEYRLTPTELLYFSFSRGFKSGGFNPRPTSGYTDTRPFAPEKASTYEVGSKLTIPDIKGTLNLALFRTDYTDVQLPVIRAVGNSPVTEIQNAGDSEILGGELEAAINPTRALRLQFGAGYLSNHFKRIDPASTVTRNDQLPDAPRWTLNGGAAYTIDLPDQSPLILRADASYRSLAYKNIPNTVAIAQAGYCLVNARITWEPARFNGFDVQLYVENATDRRYLTNALDVSPLGYLEGLYGMPRTFGVTVDYRY